MKKKWISLVIFCLVLFITACRNEYKPETTDVPDVAIMELIDLGNVPPEVVNVDRDPYLDSGIAYCFSAEEETFEEYEAEFKKKENSVILECEIADESTLLKYKHYGQCEEIYDIEDGEGDYWSKVITPVKILKIHHKGSSVETEIKVGDVLPYMEDYFKVTSDMEEVTQDYDVGT